MNSQPALQSYPALLGGYNSNTLRRWRDLLHLPQISNRKSDFVEEIAAHLAAPERMQKAIATLRKAERELLETVQHARGAMAYEQLVEIIVAKGLGREDEKNTAYRRLRGAAGSPLPQRNPTPNDVIATFEAQGLLLGTGASRSGSSVLDFGMASRYQIPAELWAQLPAPPPTDFGTAPVKDAVAAPTTMARELYILWSYIWRKEPVLLQTELLSKSDMKALAQEMPTPFNVAPIRNETEWLALYRQRRLLQASKLVTLDSRLSRLQGNQKAALAVWAKSPAEQTRFWLETWLDLPAQLYNEIALLPNLSTRRTYGGYVSPGQRGHLPAVRRLIVEQLAEAMKPDQWLSLPTFLQHLALSNRDFLYAPPGYTTSYAYGYGYGASRAPRYMVDSNPLGIVVNNISDDSQGWARVEVPFVHALVETLHQMGLLDLSRDANKRPEAIRLTATGNHLLKDGPPPTEQLGEGARVVVQPNFHIVAFGPIGERTMLELERFADRLSADRAIEYELTRKSVYRAQLSGMDAQAVQKQLEQLTQGALPQNVIRSLEEWQELHERIQVRRDVRLLEIHDPALLDEMATALPGLRKLTETIVHVTDPVATERFLKARQVEPLAQVDEGGKGAAVFEGELIRPRQRYPDLYSRGQISQLADWDEKAGAWRLTPSAVRRARREAKLDATQQIAQWKRLTGGSLPADVETRIKQWRGHYGDATLHTGTLLELKDSATLAALRKNKRLKSLLKPFKAKGVLVEVDPSELREIEALLADFGIELRGTDG